MPKPKPSRRPDRRARNKPRTARESVRDRVEEYFTGHLVQEDASLRAAIDSSARAGLPPIAVAPPEGKLLHLIARLIGARRVLEIGTLGGYSTIWLARALPADGRVITIEKDDKHANVAEENVARAGLAGRVQVRRGAALDVLPQLERDSAGPFDLSFIDADKANIPAYFDWSVRLSRPGSVIIVDNVVREGKVIDAKSKDKDVLGVRSLVSRLARDARVSATAIQTVGSKGYDGFALAVVNGS